MSLGIPENANKWVEDRLNGCLADMETALDADGLTYVGPIYYGTDDRIRDGIESRTTKRPKLVFILETGGGYIEVAQRIVDTLRHHYRLVEFIVPNHAMSAGTVLVMSGDAIYMDYYSVLGPIDPQLQRRDRNISVPALGYLEQYERLIKKSKRGQLSTAELAFLLEKFDPAELYDYEQSRELSVSLLKEWLVKYKFKDWKKTQTRKLPVTAKVRQQRAEEIARQLNNTGHWHSHGRGISMEVLKRELKLQIEDFGADSKLNEMIRGYYRLLEDYMLKLGQSSVLHTNGHYRPLSLG
jgi:hypothetical protein